jgi:hypothetical protein
MDTHVIYNTRCVVIIGTGERDTLRELDGAVTRHFDLNTVGIELCASNWILQVGDFALVQTDHFSADEVASCLV